MKRTSKTSQQLLPKTPKVAFQGALGAFSQVAAVKMAGENLRPVPLPSFTAVFESVADGKSDAAVIPIENTLHGSVHENYDHLLKFDLEIRAETSVRIVHNLIAAPGARFSQLDNVYSHPVALNQCRTFFEQNPRLVSTPYYDTAGSVKMIMEKQAKQEAAIASATAAKIYGARILKRSIEDDRENFTRFFLLTKQSKRRSAAKKPPETTKADDWKTSIVFTTRNVPGGLFRSLSAFSLRDLNLTKIESRPLRGRPWEYLFYLDFAGHVADPVAVNAIRHLSELADTLRILGCYQTAR